MFILIAKNNFKRLAVVFIFIFSPNFNISMIKYNGTFNEFCLSFNLHVRDLFTLFCFISV